MQQQAGQLAAIIRERWGTHVRTILDVAPGIGTQSIGLARKGFAVTASDLSVGAVDRAKFEARRWGVEIEFVATLHVFHWKRPACRRTRSPCSARAE
jgi:2-polyprenyl-3-methyl-5-hydroxy-6-metoxy-1,4-benzoquinol methylase